MFNEKEIQTLYKTLETVYDGVIVTDIVVKHILTGLREEGLIDTKTSYKIVSKLLWK